MKKNQNILILFFIVLTFTSCYNTILPFRIPTSNPIIPNNEIIKDIPRYENGKIFKYYKFTKQKQKQLKLYIPENGYDSLMYRFWFTYPEGFHQFGELLELSFVPNQKPIAKYYKLDIFFNPTREYEVINFSLDTLIKVPKSGWNKLIDTLNILNIKNLPTIEDLDEFKDTSKKDDLFNNTSLTVLTEVSTSSKYRFYEYNSFNKYKNITEVNNIFKLIKYLRKEFKMVDIDSDWYKE